MSESLDSESAGSDTRQRNRWQKIINERTVIIASCVIILVAIAIAVPVIVTTIKSSSANKGVQVDVIGSDQPLNNGESEKPTRPKALDSKTKQEPREEKVEQTKKSPEKKDDQIKKPLDDKRNQSLENTDEIKPTELQQDQKSKIQTPQQKEEIDKMIKKMVLELAKYRINVLDQETFTSCMRITQNCSCIYKTTKKIAFVTKDELSALYDIIGFLGDDMNVEFEVDLLLKFKRYNLEYERYPCNFVDLKRIYYTFRKDAIFIETHNRNPDRLYNMGYNQRTGMRVNYTPEVNVGYGDLFKNPKTDIGSGVYNLKGSFRQSLHQKYTPLPFDRTEIAKAPKPTFSWQDKNYVGPVANQDSCGICWGMSSIATLETFMAIKRQRFESFSVQQLLDCAYQYNSCSGGFMGPTGLYIRTHKMCTAAEYPFTGKKGACDDQKCKIETGIKESRFIDYKGAKDFLQNHGALSTSVTLSKELTHYESGIFNTECTNGVRHAMTVVGYGTDSARNVNYWIVKNSWGTEWGEGGFIRILDKPIDGPDGTQVSFCGITEGARGFM
ncbi:Papain family cysteine protease family member protein [Theileria equi strain WA]|uniref:Papain family cysteine protease family member protein n=1 Tax=Theileria equi strain WA TaxID=1537102 RepID=L1LFN8_THEEQ|nr:Papain family cysteine protease family member protein [Theileria equi strain WA]EKX73973.1 Papain family cysteine protease family member protein [Theileria equi strain WA]|eukprot:XP_004833425.1 Papain family cysteine protease family member protein [Theileria equi strain WA]